MNDCSNINVLEIAGNSLSSLRISCLAFCRNITAQLNPLILTAKFSRIFYAFIIWLVLIANYDITSALIGLFLGFSHNNQLINLKLSVLENSVTKIRALTGYKLRFY